MIENRAVMLLARAISEGLSDDDWGMIDPAYFSHIGYGDDDEDLSDEDSEAVSSLKVILAQALNAIGVRYTAGTGDRDGQV